MRRPGAGSAEKNIVLIGFMGAGKTTGARFLTRRLGCPVVCLDEAIERAEGRSVAEIFRQEGEPYFRAVERRVVEDVARRPGPLIIDSGGAAVLQPANEQTLRTRGLFVYLKVDVETVLQRIPHPESRPLLAGSPDVRARVSELLAERATAYERIADFTVDTRGKRVDQVAEEIETWWRQQPQDV